MKIVLGDSHDPYFNLSMEEYFLKNKQEDFFMLWRNDKSVIIGKNQNAYAEINQKYVSENNIKVVRRMTGGGAVFHDLGNINYTFIKRNSSDSFNDYKLFSEPIISFLKELGVDAKLSGRNDMLIGDKKFSGNAQCAYKDSIMHHGTLLFSSEKTDISESLNVNTLKITSKGIASVKSRITNISEHLNNKISVDDFLDKLTCYITEKFEDAKLYSMSEYDIASINDLKETKYLTHDWNYGFKQEFTISNEEHFQYGIVQANIIVKENHIDYLKIFGDFFGIRDIVELESILKNVEYEKTAINNALTSVNVDDYIKGAKRDDLVELLFYLT